MSINDNEYKKTNIEVVDCDDSLDKAIDDIMGENHYLDDSDSDIRLSKYIREDIHRKDIHREDK